ncbi:MAG TPA: cytochrome c3 family protein [Terriglobales bacterium]|nr:cytochrome c3 family protein [Terriglobales bacterium]
MQIFHRSANVISRASIYAGIFTTAFVLWFCVNLQRSPYVTYAGVARPQPVPFSHEHHVAALGIDCRYCHTSVENSDFAGIPPTKTCMNCHSEMWTAAPMLEPVRESYRTGKSLVWNRVNDLPDFVYFDHSIHINKGVGCNTCHGAVDRMPLMFNAQSLQMEWCIGCHRGPEKELRPRDQVFNMRYQQPTSEVPVVVDGKSFTDQMALGTYLSHKYNLRSAMDITSCSTCHR